MRGAKAKRLRRVRARLAAARPDAGVPAKVRRLDRWATRYQRRPHVAVPASMRRARAGVPRELRRRLPKVGRGCARPSEKALERQRRREREEAKRGAA